MSGGHRTGGTHCTLHCGVPRRAAALMDWGLEPSSLLGYGMPAAPATVASRHSERTGALAVSGCRTWVPASPPEECTQQASPQQPYSHVTATSSWQARHQEMQHRPTCRPPTDGGNWCKLQQNQPASAPGTERCWHRGTPAAPLSPCVSPPALTRADPPEPTHEKSRD